MTTAANLRASGALSAEQIAEVLAHAALAGDPAAAKAYGLTPRTIRRYRQRATKDGELGLAVRARLAMATEGHQDAIQVCLTKALERMGEILPEATPAEVTNAIRVLGELQIARLALIDPDPGQGPGPQAPQGVTPQGSARH